MMGTSPRQLSAMVAAVVTCAPLALLGAPVVAQVMAGVFGAAGMMAAAATDRRRADSHVETAPVPPPQQVGTSPRRRGRECAEPGCRFLFIAETDADTRCERHSLPGSADMARAARYWEQARSERADRRQQQCLPACEHCDTAVRRHDTDCPLARWDPVIEDPATPPVVRIPGPPGSPTDRAARCETCNWHVTGADKTTMQKRLEALAEHRRRSGRCATAHAATGFASYDAFETYMGRAFMSSSPIAEHKIEDGAFDTVDICDWSTGRVVRRESTGR